MCSVPDCLNESKVIALDYCNMHYKRFKKYGDPLISFGRGGNRMSPYSSPQELFLDNFDIVTESGCWLWTKALHSDGYGKFYWYGKVIRAHRFSYKLAHGEIKDGLFVCHKCDVPSCVNPDHLFLGTTQENTRDMKNKGRSARGERNAKSKLTEDIVIELRSTKLEYGDIKMLSEKHGVDHRILSAAARGLSWKHLND